MICACKNIHRKRNFFHFVYFAWNLWFHKSCLFVENDTCFYYWWECLCVLDNNIFLYSSVSQTNLHIRDDIINWVSYQWHSIHADLICVSDWNIDLCPCYILARRRIYQVTSVSCFYGRHTNFNFTLLYLTYDDI